MTSIRVSQFSRLKKTLKLSNSVSSALSTMGDIPNIPVATNRFTRQTPILLVFLCLMIGSFFSLQDSAIAEEVKGADLKLKPFILAQETTESLDITIKQIKKKLIVAGFSVVGTYSPLKDVQVLVATNPSLLTAAGNSTHGGFGAGIRISISKVGTQTQVSFVNPVYMANAYRFKSPLIEISIKLSKTLGKIKEFGSEEGLSGDDLQDYHYMFGMPYFDDPDDLASYSSFDEGIATVEASLAAGLAGASKVYRIDIPGKQETVFGVRLTRDGGSGKRILGLIDLGKIRHTAHLPYEILVTGKKAIALSAKFRIAISFPDLSMMGSGSFMDIMDAPDAIEKALTTVAKGK